LTLLGGEHGPLPPILGLPMIFTIGAPNTTQRPGQ
jgi:hypothetical protein